MDPDSEEASERLGVLGFRVKALGFRGILGPRDVAASTPPLLAPSPGTGTPLARTQEPALHARDKFASGANAATSTFSSDILPTKASKRLLLTYRWPLHPRDPKEQVRKLPYC